MVRNRAARAGPDRFGRHRGADDIHTQSRHGRRTRDAGDAARRAGRDPLCAAGVSPGLGPRLGQRRAAHAVDHRRHGGACGRRAAGRHRDRVDGDTAAVRDRACGRSLLPDRRRRRRGGHVSPRAARQTHRRQTPRGGRDHRLGDDDRGLHRHDRRGRSSARSVFAATARDGFRRRIGRSDAADPDRCLGNRGKRGSAGRKADRNANIVVP